MKQQVVVGLSDWEKRLGLLSSCLYYFADFLDDVDVPSYEKKNNPEKYIKNQVTNLNHLKTALSDKGIDPDRLSITDIDESHVSIIHDHLGQFENRTYNDKFSTYKAFFNFLISKDYPVKNVFSQVKLKPTIAKTEILSIDQFNELCSVCNPQNGVKLENKGNGRIGRKVLYRPYLIDAWKFALYSGCRPEEIYNVKFEDVQEDHIVYKNYKVSRLKNTETYRLVPITQELQELLDSLRKSNEDQDFIIASKESNRKQVIRMVSSAFTHYWNQVSDESRRFYDLCNTYATAMISKVGEGFKGRVGLHQSLKTTIKNYQNEKSVLSEMYGTRLFS